MIHQISITEKSKKDPLGQDLLTEIKRTLGIKNIKNIRTAKIYRLQGVSLKKAQEFTQKVLFEPIDQLMSFNKPLFNDADQKIEVAYKLGVMNPEVGSLLKSAIDLGINLEAADTSRQYAFYGSLTKEQLAEIAARLLVNKTVEQIIKKPPRNLIITGKIPKTEKILIRNMNDSKLSQLSKDGLFLNLEEMKVIQNYFRKIRRDPTDCEIEVLAQTWSEHCVHKTFKAKLIVNGKTKEPLINRIKESTKNNPKIIVSSFVDNSGAIDFYDGLAICGKVETHNSPSAIEPYGGAMTGSGGVFRDILGTGQGAKVLASSDIFCFAPPNMPSKLIPPGCLPPDYLLRKVVAGVRDYGNRVGIPTNNGSVHFHEDFRAKPTVAAGAYGIISKKQAKKTWPKKGDLIVTIGGRTGRDGIHGATFSSGEMTDKTITVSGSSVQIGNAIEEKRMIDAIIQLSSINLIRTLTDCGAGGYSSAIGEMGQKTGAQVFLEKVPLKYSGLAPWEIFLSESQERMVLAIAPKNLKKTLQITKLYNVQASVIGKFDGSKRLKVTYLPAGRHGKNQIVCDLSMEFLHDGLPQRVMTATSSPDVALAKSGYQSLTLSEVEWFPPLPETQKQWESTLEKILSHGNVCSKEPIVRLYDHNVQGTNALHPFSGVNYDGPNDGAIVKPILKKPYGLVITHGLNPTLNKIDPYWGSIWALVEAVSNYVAVGGKIEDAALIDNFIWPFPDEKSLADLDKSVDALTEVAKRLKMPFVSGKDSLSSTYRYKNGEILKIPPVVLISVFGKIKDVKKTTSSDFKKVNSTIVLVGKPDLENFGGSTYFDITQKHGQVPKIDLQSIVAVFNSVNLGIENGQILACHDISEGGLISAVAEMSFGANFGASIDPARISESTRPDLVLFNETAGTFLVEVENEKVARKLFAKVPHAIIGKTLSDQYISVNLGAQNLRLSVSRLKSAWQRPMKEIFH